MTLPELSIKRPVLVLVLNFIILLFGYLGYRNLGVRELPSIDPPVITVRTAYTGANAEVIESQITEPLEKAINGIEGVRSISSASNLGASVITVEFNLDAELERAANDVRDKVSQAVRQLPEDIDAPPTVVKADANSDAILSMTVQSDTRSHLDLSDFGENVIAQRLQTIPGISSYQIWGQKKYAMRLWLDPTRMAHFGITPSMVRNALASENIELPAGRIEGSTTELAIKTNVRLNTEEDFNNLIILSAGDRKIQLSDIGKAELGAQNEQTILRMNGQPMIAVALVPQPGANYLSIADEFYKRVEILKKELPADIQLDVALDTTIFIKQSVIEVVETLAIAIILVVIIIYLFFRDWIVALRPLIDIPVSLIGTFFVMYVFGFTINVLTLLAIVLATGLVVDDGIVVTENIFKKIEKGMSPKEAAIKGGNEIMFAVWSTSLTLASVFLPIIFMPGFVGLLFREFGLVVAVSVLISAFVSLTLTPLLNAFLNRKTAGHGRFYNMTEPFFEQLNSRYKMSIMRFVRKPTIALGIIGVCFSLFAYLYSITPQELAPLEDRSMLRVSMKAYEGASYEYMDNFIQKQGTLLKDSLPEAKMILTVSAPGFAGSGAVNTGFARIVLTDPHERKRSQQAIASWIMMNGKKNPDASVFAIQEPTIKTGGLRPNLPVQYVIQAPNFERLREKIPLFLDKVAASPVFSTFDIDLKFNKPELDVTVNRQQANAAGISPLEVAQAIQLAFSGQRTGYFVLNGKQYEVINQFERPNRDDPADLKGIYLRNPEGKILPLSSLVTTEERSSPPQLYHYNRYLSATVSAGMNEGYTLGEGIEEMDRIKAEVLEEDFSTDLTGTSRDFAESASSSLFIFVLALLLVYLILAAQFESFIYPLIILSTVPLAFTGALIGLWYFNQSLNIFSQIGLVMLVGLVTKNGILIVEFANQLREQGYNRVQAAIQAAVSRLRPILMTSLATALGALPIALALGAGSESRQSMGIVIVVGILFSLILTLYVIPALYILFTRKDSHAKV
jgi:multidrug efflux pump